MTARRAALALIAVAMLAGAVAPSAGAHTTLLRSEPADASSLAKPPRRIQLWFSGALVPSDGAVVVRDAAGKAVAGTRLDLSAARAGKAVLMLPRLKRGVYILDWRVRFAGDLHLAEGAISFGVGTRAVPAAERDPAASIAGVDVFLRWLGFLCLAGIAGGLAVAMVVFSPLGVGGRGEPLRAAVERAHARALGLAAVCAAGSVTVGVGALSWQTSSLGTTNAWQLVNESRWGSLWIARELLALALLAAILLLLRDGQPRRRPLVLCSTVTLALALVGVQALSGHAFELAPHRAFAVVVAGVHLLAALVWIGGVLAAAVSLWPLFGTRARESAALARACLAPFSVLAAGCVSLLAVTGLYYAGRQVASLDALLTTLYGQALLGKLGIVLCVGALGLLNGMLLRRATTRLRSLLVAETTLGFGVLLVVGLLTAAPPARGPEFARAPASTPSYLSSSADDLLVSVSVKPNRPGPNNFEVGAVSTRRPAPGPIEQVRLRFTGPRGSVTSPPLTEIEPGRYRATGGYLNESGGWSIETLVDRATLGESRARFDWAVAPAGAPRPVLVSRRPLGPVLTNAAVLLLLCVVVGWGWWLLRRLSRGQGVLLDPLVAPRLERRVE